MTDMADHTGTHASPGGLGNRTVTVTEVGPRDGLQTEARLIPAADKIALVDLATSAGFRAIEVTSFVSPAWVPQMADAAQVMAGIARRPGVRYSALAPNLRGFAAARAAGADEVAIFAAASERFSRKNINATIDESFARFEPVAQAAAEAGIPLRGYLSCVTHCPHDGPVAPRRVLDVARRLQALGVREISLGETLGRARPEEVDTLLGLLCAELPADLLAGHFHDTAGHAVDNVRVALDHGLRVFDSSLGGLGGCPYAPGAAGNLATETLHAALVAAGFDTGLDPAALARAAAFARALKAPQGAAS